MSSREVLYADGSQSTFGGGGGMHAGGLAITRIRLITARSALRTYIQSEGKWQLTANGAQLAIKNVIEPLTGNSYKRSMKGKQAALDDCEALIWAIENDAVVWEGEE
jgi:hypothetical protein